MLPLVISLVVIVASICIFIRHNADHTTNDPSSASSSAPDTITEETSVSSSVSDTTTEQIAVSSTVSDTITEQIAVSSSAPDTTTEQIADPSSAPDTTTEQIPVSSSAPDTTTEQIAVSSSVSDTDQKMINIKKKLEPLIDPYYGANTTMIISTLVSKLNIKELNKLNNIEQINNVIEKYFTIELVNGFKVLTPKDN